MVEVLMDEKEWLTGTDAGRMVEHVHPRPRERSRKYLLLNAACCRLLRPWIDDERAAAAIDRAEKGADGELTEATLARWRGIVTEFRAAAGRSADMARARWAVEALFSDRRVSHAPTTHAWRAFGTDRRIFGDEFATTAPAVLLALVRDIFGNPFRPVAFDPGWRTETAVALARGMYDGRDFALMPILADALEDAGCDHPDVLAHCRNRDQPHVRGCWVIDGVLGLS